MKLMLLSLLILPAIARAEESWRRVALFSGTGPAITSEFKVVREWRVRWLTVPQVRELSSFFLVESRSANRDLEQVLADAPATERQVAHGTKPGSFHLDVTAANCTWKILVEERPPLDGTAVEGMHAVPPDVDPFTELHTWTRSDGATVDAYLVSATETDVKMYRPSDGRHFDYPLWKLSQADRDFVAAQRSNSPPDE